MGNGYNEMLRGNQEIPSSIPLCVGGVEVGGACGSYYLHLCLNSNHSNVYGPHSALMEVKINNDYLFPS